MSDEGLILDPVEVDATRRTIHDNVAFAADGNTDVIMTGFGGGRVHLVVEVGTFTAGTLELQVQEVHLPTTTVWGTVASTGSIAATGTFQATLAGAKSGAVRLRVVAAGGADFAGVYATLSSSPVTDVSAIETTLTSLDGKDFAEQTTLAEVSARLGDETTPVTGSVSERLESLNTRFGEGATPTADTLQARVQETIDLLTLVKDTDGVRKITDELPAGTQDIGSFRLRDILGNGVNSILNNVIRRLEARASITSPDGTGDVGVDNSRLQVVDESYAVARDDIVVADNFRQGISATGYAIAIDLNNAGAYYKHSASSTGLELYAMSGTLVKSQTGSDWRAIAGVVLRIDGTDADVAWLEFLSLHAEDSSTNVVHRQREAFPVPLDLTVSSGVLSKIAAGFIELNIAAINTGITLLDIEGIGRTPAVGDMVSRVELLSGSGTADLHASLSYRGVT